MSPVSGLDGCIVPYCCRTISPKLRGLKQQQMYYVRNESEILEQFTRVAWPRVSHEIAIKLTIGAVVIWKLSRPRTYFQDGSLTSLSPGASVPGCVDLGLERLERLPNSLPLLDLPFQAEGRVSFMI